MQTKQQLDAREVAILEAIIRSYINIREPVSSRKLAKIINFKLSPATIRNIMADLEDMEYLVQPHTSAGRIPTDKAYRLLVEHLLDERSQLPEIEQSYIHSQLDSITGSRDDLIQSIPKIINTVSSYVGVSLFLNYRNIMVKEIHLISVELRKILFIIVTLSGSIYQKVLSLEEVIDQDELNNVSNAVNTSFQGLSLFEIRDKISAMLEEDKNIYDTLLKKAISYSKEVFDEVSINNINSSFYIEGTSSMLDLPELADIDKMKKIFEAFLEKKRLIMLLNEFMKDDGINVCIGSESPNENLSDLSVIISPYKSGDRTIGGLGVIGPTRMPYGRMIAMIDYLSKSVSNLLTSKEVVTFE